jgi:hypothetical protein
MALTGASQEALFFFYFCIAINPQMELNNRIEAFSELGHTLSEALEGRGGTKGNEMNRTFDRQQHHNPWFTPENVRMAAGAIAVSLAEEKLKAWTGRYPGLKEEHDPFTTAVIMAGNIPLVGFHDLLSVLISGNRVLVKTSSKDSELIKMIGSILISINHEFEKLISFTEDNLTGFDAVIATGSDNSSRYFEYYFGKYPHIIRKNRNSVAVINGDETGDEFRQLGRDVFSYFGLGCRNVSKLYLPAGFSPGRILDEWQEYSGIISHSKYANNYEYNMAVWLVNREKFLDNGFILLRENSSLSSPVAALHYDYYSSSKSLSATLNALSEKIQCIVGGNHIPFGSAQSPELWDYADNSDTLDFLLKKNLPGIS